MPEKEEINVVKWVKYLYSKSKKHEEALTKIKQDITDIRKKQELLGESVLNLYKK